MPDAPSSNTGAAPVRAASGRRVLVIGWDGADWRFARPLMEQGKMPHLSRLVQRGASGNLATLKPVLSPMLWNSIATGKRPAKHGVHGFCEVTPDGGGVRPVQSGSRTCKALWNIASQAGLTSNVVGWYASHPAEPVRGAVVTNHFQQAVATPEEPWPVPPGSVHPAELEKTLADLRVHPMEIDHETVSAFIPELGSGLDSESPLLNPKKHRKLGELMELLAHTSTIHTSATWLMEHTDWDLMAVYYEGIDRFAHAFMGFHPPRMEHVPEETFQRYRHVMEACYRFHDMMLGATLRLVGEDTTVVLLSDHGYHFDHLRPKGPVKQTDPVAWHHPLGLLAMAGPGVRQGQTILGANLLDVAPTVLNLLGLPFGLDMDGKPLAAALDPAVSREHVLSWELIDGEDGRPDASRAAEAVTDPEAEKEALRQLAELGYIEPLGEDAEQRVARVRRANRLCLVQSLMDAGDNPAAEAQLREMLPAGDPPELTRDHAPVLELLNECLLGRHALDEVEQNLQRLGEIQGDSGASARTLTRARVAAARGDAEAAMEMLRGEDAAAAGAPAFELQMAQLMLATGRLDEAEAGFGRVLESDPDQPLALDGLAAVALRRDDPAAALEHCLAVLQRVYFLPRTHLRLGVALRKLHDLESAILATRVARHQAPGWEAARLQLVSLLHEAGRPEEARAEARAQRTDFDALVAADLAARREADAAASRDGVVTVVSGLPRSGTSLMMQLLGSGGLPSFTDGRRKPDASNPRGYHEHAGVLRLASDPGVLRGADGHAVKVVHALVEHLPPGPRYRVIWMDRHLDEVLASQAAMVQRLAEGAQQRTPRDREALRRVFAGQAERALGLLRERRDVDLRVVEHAALLADPVPVLRELIDWLELDATPEQLAEVVDPSLHRQRLETAIDAR
ncbi:alkaline phosphatase family protein [Phycisphaera mikurensis]|nr:alkaline phosphatase family protein [Phycisphaera mikurensis]MBB6442098.1 putative AlkP superfamily phosphohydrolase/phosphomutase/tetratricopeptide (TPR) repeat protein [Phycisphaera mikurensis]